MEEGTGLAIVLLKIYTGRHSLMLDRKYQSPEPENCPLVGFSHHTITGSSSIKCHPKAGDIA